MASPPISPSLLQLAARPFSFYPAIVGAEPNQWRVRSATWQDLLVVNTRSGVEASIPRRFVGEISPVGDPVLIVGLLRELQFVDGVILPYQRRVIEMPIAVGASIAPRATPLRRPTPAQVIGIRLEPRRDRRVYKILGGAMAVAIFLYVASSNLLRMGDSWQRASARRNADLGLVAGDDSATIARKLGKPISDRASVQEGQTFRALGYRRFSVVLGNGRYIGRMDDNWRPLDIAPGWLPTLRRLKRF